MASSGDLDVKAKIAKVEAEIRLAKAKLAKVESEGKENLVVLCYSPASWLGGTTHRVAQAPPQTR